MQDKASRKDTTWLVFGCRNQDKDYLFREDWEAKTSNESLNRFDVCFSRDGSDVKYVQHVLQENGKHLAQKILEKDSMIFVCGSNSMAKDVNETIIKALHQHSELTEAEAKEKIAEMRIGESYQQEIWS